MTKQLRKVISILCAVILLFSSLITALAEEAAPAEEESVQTVSVQEAEQDAAEEEAARKAAEKEAAEKETARKAAEEEAACKAAEKEAAEKEAARKAAEEEAARKAAEKEAAEKEAARKAAEDEAAREATGDEAGLQDAADETEQEEAADGTAANNRKEEPETPEQEAEICVDNEETEQADPDQADEIPEENNPATDDENLNDDDPEADGEDEPEMTDEPENTRNLELAVGQTLSERLEAGEELTITLKQCHTSDVELKLYAASGASISMKVDGKTVAFTPADSDIPSMNLYVYELAHAAGRSHEIVLVSEDSVSFRFAAAATQKETTEDIPEKDTDEQENATPAAENSGNASPAEEATSDNPVPTVQSSLKNYDALRIGESLSDTLAAGQKARIQVKCERNPFVTLILNTDPDDAVVKIEGGSADFVSAGNGIYFCELNNVAFRKYDVVISAKKDLAFTLNTAANREAEEEASSGETENTPAEDSASSLDVSDEAEEESAGIENETVAGNTEADASEETSDPEKEDQEEDQDEAGDAVDMNDNEAGDSEQEPAEEAEATGEEDHEEEAAEADENETEENESTEETELTEDEQLIESGYRKIQIVNEKGIDTYDGFDEEAAVTGHADFGSELWIKDAEAEGWAEVYTEDEISVFIRLADNETQEAETGEETEKPEITEEEMLGSGYIKAQIIKQDGADIYALMDTESDIIAHLDQGEELWVRIIEGTEWAAVYSEDDQEKYVLCDDLMVVLKGAEEEAEVRSVTISTSLDGEETVYYGTPVQLIATLENFLEDDSYTVQWYYRANAEKDFRLIKNANELIYEFIVEPDNIENTWKIEITLLSKEDGQGQLPEESAEDLTPEEEIQG